MCCGRWLRRRKRRRGRLSFLPPSLLASCDGFFSPPCDLLRCSPLKRDGFCNLQWLLQHKQNTKRDKKKKPTTVFFLLPLVDDEAIAALHEIATFAIVCVFRCFGAGVWVRGSRVWLLPWKHYRNAESRPVFAKIWTQHDLLQLVGRIFPSLSFFL